MTTPTHRQPIVAVFGSSTAREGEPAYVQARELGAALAARGLVTLTGGYAGAMAAASQGAHEAGGHVIGVTVELFEQRGPVNRWVKERVHTPDLFERLRYIMHACDGFVVAAGSIGTLTELFLAWTLVSAEARARAPIVLMGAHWHAWLAAHQVPESIPAWLHPYVQVADTPEAAADLVAGALGMKREARLAAQGSASPA